MSSHINGVHTSASASASSEGHAVNGNLTPSTSTRRVSHGCLSSRNLQVLSGHPTLSPPVHSFSHLNAWRHTAERHELIALGQARVMRKVLGWDEVKMELGRMSKLKRLGWAGVLPITTGPDVDGRDGGPFVGWTVKGGTW